MSEGSIHWQEANQRYLMAAVAVVRAHLSRRLAMGSDAAARRSPDGLAKAEQDRTAAASALPSPSALETVCSVFSLSAFERDVLLMCAAMELDGTFVSSCVAAQGDPSRPYPTFGLALAVLPDPHWSALTPNGSLRRWRLLELAPGEALVRSRLHIDESVLHFLAGLPYVDERLAGLVDTVSCDAELVPSHRGIAERLASVWSDRMNEGSTPVMQLTRGERNDKRSIVTEACARLGWKLGCISAENIPAGPSDCEQLARLWERVAALDRCILYIDAEQKESLSHAVTAFAEHVQSPVVIGSRERIVSLLKPVMSFDVEKPTPKEQLALWRAALGQSAVTLDGALETIVAQFSLDSGAIREISEGVACDAQDGLETQRVLVEACRLRTRSHCDDLAMRIEPRACWDDLVLPEGEEETLRIIAASVRQRFRVQESWGFARKSSRGNAITALFSGPSGTGKTMAAEVLANDMQLDLLRIDLSRVVSKYIGETEKNLRRVFEAAEKGGAILFFDEADALFGKRSEVKDSHDRYANIEISYLLQRMEEYTGLAILATNMRETMDVAFLRRIRFVVHFPFPDAAQRAKIWRRIFPAETPTENLCMDRLASLSISGGNIRNMAVYAAFLAADAGEPVRMAHIARAASAEYGKLGRSLSAAEIGGLS
jgi:hypothetical protein